MFKVITGQPRHGKSQYTVKDEILYRIADNEKREKDGKLPRKIYCDFDGINDDDTLTKLPEVINPWTDFGFEKTKSKWWFGEPDDPQKPDDFICPDPGAVFIFDEAHKIDWIKDSSGMLSKHPTAISMNEHGHLDFIIVIVTQFPAYIHTHLRGLVEYHYHVKRFNGLKRSKIYKWNEFKVTPRAANAMSDAYEVETFVFNDKYQNCYKSASAHDSMRFKFPKEWFKYLIPIFLFGGFAIHNFMKSPLLNVAKGEEGASVFTSSNVKKDSKNSSSKPLSSSINDNQIEVNDKQIQANEMHITLINQYKNKIEMQQKIIEMHESKIHKQIVNLEKLRLHNTYLAESRNPSIRVAGVVKFNGKCQTINSFGDVLIMSDKECKSYVDNRKMLSARLDNQQDSLLGQDSQQMTFTPITSD